MMIPLDVFMVHIHPFLVWTDILNLSGVSKEMYLYFNENEMWKKFHWGAKTVRSIPKKMNQLTWSKVPPNDTMSWPESDIRLNKCVLQITNESDIPMDVFYVREMKGGRTRTPVLKSRGGSVKNLGPGKTFKTSTYPNHRWICIPTATWFYDNPVSNVGFSFVVNILKNVIVEDKPMNVHVIKQPPLLNPIKGLKKTVASHKREFIRLSVDPDTITLKARASKKASDIQDKELKRLYKRVRVLEENAQEFRRNGASYKMTQDIFLEGSPIGDAHKYM